VFIIEALARAGSHIEMSSQQQRLPVFPTRMYLLLCAYPPINPARSLNNVKVRQKSAQKGHSLLKRKSDALTARFRQILTKIHAAKMAMGQLMKSGALALAELNFATSSDIGYMVREGVTGPAQMKLKARMENVSGVQLPIFETQSEGGANGIHLAGYILSDDELVVFELTGLGRGGQQVQKCKEVFTKALEALVQLASLQVPQSHLADTAWHGSRRPSLYWTMLSRQQTAV
jgi:V-type H+-transporting ATPase subunit D